MTSERIRSYKIRRVYEILNHLKPGVTSDEIEAAVEKKISDIGLRSEMRIKSILEKIYIVERVEKTDEETDRKEKEDFIIYFKPRLNRLHDPMPLQVKTSVESKERAKLAIKKKGKRQMALAGSGELNDKQIITSFFDQLKHFDGFV